MRRTSRFVARLSEQELTEVEAARAAARALFAHLVDEEGDHEDAGEVDPENPPMMDADLARLRPAAETAPHLVAASLRRKGGRPRSETPKVAVSIRLDPDVLGALRASGEGWQGRVNAMLRLNLGLDHPDPVVAGNVVRVGQALAQAAAYLAEAREVELLAERAIARGVAEIEASADPARQAFDDAAGAPAHALPSHRPRVG